jgi:hypothetical protein
MRGMAQASQLSERIVQPDRSRCPIRALTRSRRARTSAAEASAAIADATFASWEAPSAGGVVVKTKEAVGITINLWRNKMP